LLDYSLALLAEQLAEQEWPLDSVGQGLLWPLAPVVLGLWSQWAQQLFLVVWSELQ